MPSDDLADDTRTDAEASIAPSIADLRIDRTATDGAGAYFRDRDGTWRYTIDGTEVPGARDLTLRDLFDPPSDDAGDVACRVVPRDWASRHPDHPLAWIFEHAELGDRAPIRVPEAEWKARADLPVALAAPELHPLNLIGVDGVAELVGVAPATVRSYLARAQMPEPIVRVGGTRGTPLWSRPVILRWIDGRPRARVAVLAADEPET